MSESPSISISSLSVYSKFKVKRGSAGNWNSRKSKTELNYLSDINLEFKGGDRVLIIDKSNYSKPTLIRVASKMLLPSKGSVSVAGEIFPGISPAFGIIPKATLHQNTILRSLNLNFNKAESVEYYKSIFENPVLNRFRSTYYGDLSSDFQTLYLIQSLSPLKASILLLDSWMGAPSDELKLRSRELLKKLVNNADIALLGVTKSKFISDICNMELLLEAGQVVSCKSVSEYS